MFREPSSLAVDGEADQFTFDHIYCPAGSAVEEEVMDFVRKRNAKEAKKQARSERQQQKAAQAEAWARKHPLRTWWRKLRGKA